MRRTCVAAFFQATTIAATAFDGVGASACMWIGIGMAVRISAPAAAKQGFSRRPHGRFSHRLVASCEKVASLRALRRSPFRVNRPSIAKQPSAQQRCARGAVPVRGGVGICRRRPAHFVGGSFRSRSSGSRDHSHGSRRVDAGRGEKARRSEWRRSASCLASTGHARKAGRGAAVPAASHRIVRCRCAAAVGCFRSTSSPSRAHRRARLIYR